jgi:hypothetical protein
MKPIRICLVVLAAMMPTLQPAMATDELKFEGSAFLDEEGCAKGLMGPECVVTLSITGKAAETLFNGLPGKAEREECTGGLGKSSKAGLHCTHYDNDNTYECNFGYEFKKQKFGGSAMDC